MEEDKDMSYEESATERAKAWLQENLRIVTSIFIVAVIAFGIYSYSDRTVPSDESGLQKIASSETTKNTDSDAVTSEEAEELTAEEDGATENADIAASGSSETESSFIETAERGEGLTHLARHATSDYLEKNADSSLTVEHLIYIEDYLRKNVSHEGGVKIGTSVEFSKDLIREAITSSKNLTPNQLENLKQYSARVSAFRK